MKEMRLRERKEKKRRKESWREGRKG